MSKTRRMNKKTRRTYVKKGGKKNNADMARMTSQMIGGQAPAPSQAQAPAPAAVNINLDYSSVVRSLQTYGDTVWKLKEATATGVDAAAQRVLAARADETAIQSLNIAATALYNAFFGNSSTGTNGLYKTILPNETYVAPPAPPPA